MVQRFESEFVIIKNGDKRKKVLLTYDSFASHSPFIVYTHNVCIGRHWIVVVIFFSFHYSKTKKRFTSLLWHQIWTATRPRIINTFWYNNDFFFTRNKEIGKCVLLSFFFILQCLRLFSIDLVRIFLCFILLCNFYGRAGGSASKMLIIFTLLICEFLFWRAKKTSLKMQKKYVVQ